MRPESAFAAFGAGNFAQGGPSGSGVSSISTAALTGCSSGGQYFIVGAITNQNGMSGVTVSSTSLPTGAFTVLTPWVVGGANLTYFYAYSASISDSEVFTATKSGSLYSARIFVQCFSGALNPVQVDKSNTHVCDLGAYDGGSGCTPGSITPSQGSELVMSYIIDNKNMITGPPSGYTSGGTFSNGGAFAYKIQTTPTTTNPAWPLTAEYHYDGAGIVSFLAASPVLDYTVSGPGSGLELNASTNFTVTIASGTFNGSQTVTISDGSQGGTITPSVGSSGISSVVVTPTNGSSSFTFTYTPAVAGTISLTFTGAGMTGSNPNSIIYTSNPLTLSLSCGASSGTVGIASVPCTVTSSMVFSGAQTVTITDDGEYVCGTLTPSVGNAGCGTITVTPPSGNSFTFTYTPLGPVGPHILTFTNNFFATNPANFTYTATAAAACTFTAQANGNWNAAGTWTGCGDHTTPISGDTVTITGYNVTCSTGTCYAGTAPANNTTYDITVAQSGSASGTLEVASGATLFLSGNYKLNSSAGASPTKFAVLKLDTGATFIHDNANGSVQYRGYGGASANWNNIVFGTQGDTCTFSAAFGYSCGTKYIGVDVAGGYNPVLFAMGTLYDDITYQIYGTSLKNCGATAVPCLDYGSNNNANGYANAGVIDVEDSVFDNTSLLGSAGTYYASALTKLTWARNRMVNDIAGWLAANPTHMLGLAGAINTCNISGNYFSSLTNPGKTDYSQGCTWSGNVFALGWYLNNSATHPTGTFQNNVVVTSGIYSFPSVHWNNINNIWLCITSGPSSCHLGPAWSDPGPFTLIGSVAQKWNTTPTASEGHCGYGSDSSASIKQFILDNLGVMGNSGDPPCQWWDSANSVPSVPGSVGYVDHNGSNGVGYIAWIASDGHGSLYYPSNATIGSIRANIAWAPSASVTNLFLGDQQADGIAPNTMIGANSVVDWNNIYNGHASTLFSGGADANCSTSTFNGTPYQICASIGGPGSHETTANPNYVDSTRGFDTWAIKIKGQNSSLNGYLSALWQCTDIRTCIDQSRAWVRQGWQPTNMALKGTAPDGYLIGVNGSLGTGYTPGTCTATITIVDATDLASSTPGSLGCTINSSTTPVITVTNPGAHYLISNPATVLIDDGHGHTSTGLTVKLNPMDIGPVPIYNFASVAQ